MRTLLALAPPPPTGAPCPGRTANTQPGPITRHRFRTLVALHEQSPRHAHKHVDHAGDRGCCQTDSEASSSAGVRRADLGHAAGCRRLPRLDEHDAPAAAPDRAVRGPPQPGPPPGHEQARADGQQARARLERGHHKLRGPDRGGYYDLYVIIDIYSRYVVGWTVPAREDADIAKALIASAAQVHGAPDICTPTAAPR